jgi:hypothetical protein
MNKPAQPDGRAQPEGHGETKDAGQETSQARTILRPQGSPTSLKSHAKKNTIKSPPFLE